MIRYQNDTVSDTVDYTVLILNDTCNNKYGMRLVVDRVHVNPCRVPFPPLNAVRT
jgi:hypothetical protein